MYSCDILADSITIYGHRLTTFCVTFPRFILAEVNTHRMLSRNSASSRAIPIAKSIQAVIDDPFVPLAWGKNQPGMSAEEDVAELQAMLADTHWRNAMEASLQAAEGLAEIDVHKALGNRILEPFKWHTAILSATDWGNFYALRTDANAQPEFRTIALMMEEAHRQSEPLELGPGSLQPYHLPLVTKDEILDESLTHPDPFVDWELWKQVSVGRCARVSYLTHQGVRDLAADVQLYDRLKENGHLSPFEHVARPFSSKEWQIITTTREYIRQSFEGHDPLLVDRMCRQMEYNGNFRGWYQTRADIPYQDDFTLLKEQQNAIA